MSANTRGKVGRLGRSFQLSLSLSNWTSEATRPIHAGQTKPQDGGRVGQPTAATAGRNMLLLLLLLLLYVTILYSIHPNFACKYLYCNLTGVVGRGP